jgi:hypothetical protein
MILLPTLYPPLQLNFQQLHLKLQCFFFCVLVSLTTGIHQEIKPDQTLGMITNTQFRIFCQLFFMAVNLVSHIEGTT